jgi:mitosis inhibitor protein kinase SWE1
MLPPDPSGLSISAHGDGHAIQNFGSSLFLPATPTASRDRVSLFGKSGLSVTPVHGPNFAEVDGSLLSKFKKVEIIGSGEFSQVFRVTQRSNSNATASYFTLPKNQTSPETPMPHQVWAVKKSRNAYIGPKDRQRKLHEVEVLKALGRSDHTVELVDHWEHNDHLYIQTEYCEEGSLDLFLDRVGRNARLDDFRIWKIMLELSLVSLHILTLQCPC